MVMIVFCLVIADEPLVFWCVDNWACYFFYVEVVVLFGLRRGLYTLCWFLFF